MQGPHTLLFKVSVNENFSTLLDFAFFWIFGMRESQILFWQKKKIRKCSLTLLKWAFSELTSQSWTSRQIFRADFLSLYFRRKNQNSPTSRRDRFYAIALKLSDMMDNDIDSKRVWGIFRFPFVTHFMSVSLRKSRSRFDFFVWNAIIPLIRDICKFPHTLF